MTDEHLERARQIAKVVAEGRRRLALLLAAAGRAERLARIDAERARSSQGDRDRLRTANGWVRDLCAIAASAGMTSTEVAEHLDVDPRRAGRLMAAQRSTQG